VTGAGSGNRQAIITGQMSGEKNGLVK